MPRQQRPNILWYCSDAQRFDTIHALGNNHIRTPTRPDWIAHRDFRAIEPVPDDALLRYARGYRAAAE